MKLDQIDDLSKISTYKITTINKMNNKTFKEFNNIDKKFNK